MPIPLSLIERFLEIGQDAYRATPQITASTLVVQGARDEVVRASQTQKLLARFAGPATAISGGAGHAQPIAPSSTAWPEVSSAVRAFASELAAEWR